MTLCKSIAVLPGSRAEVGTEAESNNTITEIVSIFI